jgi:hypothetical protein
MKPRIVHATGINMIDMHGRRLWHCVTQADHGTLADHYAPLTDPDEREEYWRARMITGMTNQNDPFFFRSQYHAHNYGRRRVT